MSEEGKVLREVIHGIGKNGEKIQETLTFDKDGETVLTRRVELLGEEAALWEKIKAEEKAARAEEKAIWEQVKNEQKAARDEEKQLWKEVQKEQAEAIKLQKERNKADEDMVRRSKQRDAAAFAAEIKEQENAVKAYTDALVNQYNAEATLATAKTGTATHGVLAKQAEEAAKQSERAKAAINSMDIPDGVKKDMIASAENSERVAEAMHKVE